MTAKRGTCPVCHRPDRAIRADGRIVGHGLNGTRCNGSGQLPADTRPDTTGA